jgi:hypothetical protein
MLVDNAAADGQPEACGMFAPGGLIGGGLEGFEDLCQKLACNAQTVIPNAHVHQVIVAG